MSEVRVPDGWEVRRLGEFCQEQSKKFDGQSDIPVLSVTKYDGFVSSLDYFNKQVFSRDLSSYKVVERGQFAYATIHLDEGSLGLLKDYENGLISPMYTVFQANRELDSDFLFYLMKSDLYMTKYPALGQGSINRRMSISFKTLSGLQVHFPPLPEQQKIASTLTSADEVIEKIQSQINKLQDLKKGTMNELLTRGIGHTEFKDSPVGRIPKGWEVVPLSKVTSNYDSKRVPVKSSDRQEMQGTYRYYGASGVIDYVDDYLFDGEYILLGEDGENVLSRNLPLAFIVKGKFWVNNHAHIFQPVEGVEIGYLCEYLESLDYTNIASGSAQPKITKSSLSKIRVKLPFLEEQQQIASILSSIDKNIEEKQRKLTQIQSLKKSLMQDLLTGKKRVMV